MSSNEIAKFFSDNLAHAKTSLFAEGLEILMGRNST
jgi:hypothetical protein